MANKKRCENSDDVPTVDSSQPASVGADDLGASAVNTTSGDDSDAVVGPGSDSDSVRMHDFVEVHLAQHAPHPFIYIFVLVLQSWCVVHR